MDFDEVERWEMARLAGKMIRSLEYLQSVKKVRESEGSSHHFGLSEMIFDLNSARERIVALSRELPEGRLEAFAREHPLFQDDLDGDYCGYGVKEGGKHFACPVHDHALHWDAWEMMGTSRPRPDKAKRKQS